jgi:hypothetical protein
MEILFTLYMNILNFKKVKYIYICFGLVFESLENEVDLHVCSFFLYLIISPLDLFVYVTQIHECTNVFLLML